MPASLLSRMVLLSLPCFIGPTLFWFPFIASDAHVHAFFNLMPTPYLVLVALAAMAAQVITLPLVALTVFHGLLGGPSGNRAAAVVLFCVCFAGLYASFGWFFTRPPGSMF
jgi:hypothetical protein